VSPHHRRGKRARWTLVAIEIGVGLVVIGAIALAAGWRDLVQARGHLLSAKSGLADALNRSSSLETGRGRAEAAQRIDQAAVEVADARQILQRSLPIRLARFVPGTATQRTGLLHLVDDSQVALTVGRTLITEIDGLVAGGHVNGARVPLSALAQFEGEIRAAATTVSALERSSAGLWGSIGGARRDFDHLASTTGSRLAQDADSLRLAERLMGASGIRRYFVALQNNAEMRDQGMVLEYAIVTFDHGQLHVDQEGPITTTVAVPGQGMNASLLLKNPTPVPLPSGTAAVFGDIRPTQLWQSVNATADFAWTGQTIRAMYREATGQDVDGVIAIDVPALSALLDVVGPVMVPGIGVPVTSSNASTVLLHDLYDSVAPSEQGIRKERLSGVAAEVITRLKAGSFDPVPLAQRLATAAAGGHLRLWSADPSEERTLESVALGGGPATTSADRTFHLAVENRNATKMDYYIRPSVEQHVLVTRYGAAIIRTTVSVLNTAPFGAKPSYQLGPDGSGTTQPGEYWAWVLLWGPAGATQPGAVNESGLNLSQSILDKIYAGQTKRVTFDTIIPLALRDGVLQLRYVPQPRLVAPTLDVVVDAEGWSVSGPREWSGSWNRAITLNWKLRK
jgi:Protein of unknown function (DUF4012)